MKNLYQDTNSVTFLVLGGDQAVQYSPTVPGKVALDDFAGDAVNIADKQLGVVVDEHTDTALEKHFLVTGQTAANVKKIRLIQGTPMSASVSAAIGHRLGDQPYVQSNPIDLSKPIKIQSWEASHSSSSAWVIGDLAANPGSIDVVDNVVYKFKIALGGRKQKKMYSNSGVNRMYINIQKLPATATNVRDRFIKRACAELNKLSSHQGRRVANSTRQAGNKPALALAINIGGGAGTSITTILAAAVGTKYTYETDGTVNYQITVTEDLKKTLTAVVANITNITNATTIEVINLATAGTVAMGAGAAAADAILVLGLDTTKAIVDDRLETHKTTIEQVGLEGFTNVVRKEVGSRTFRGFGYGWQLYNEYLKAAQQEINGGETLPLENRPQMPIPYYMAKDETQYDVHEIWHEDDQVQGNTEFNRVSRIVIIAPAADTTTSTSMNTGLRTLLESTNDYKVYTSATSPAIFV